MKCPACGDIERQDRIGPIDDGQSGWRCARCGRVYAVRSDDLADIVGRLDEMKLQGDELHRRRERLLALIAQTEAQLRCARDQLDQVQRRLREEGR